MFDKIMLKEIYHFEGTGQTLVINELSGELYLKKKLKIYNTGIYEYLKTHYNIHIPRIYDYEEESGILTIYEEYIEGKTLEDIISNGTIPEKKALAILDGILDGLAFLHSANPEIIHRDIKPSNIIITNDGIVKIIDYNAAKFFNENEEKDTVLIGTNGYAAPEQYGFMPSTVRTDIFSVGKLMEKILPYTRFYEKIFKKATAMNPDDRYKDVGELRKAVFGESKGRYKEANKKNIFGRILDHVPGFRSRTPWKMIVAIFCDVTFLYFLFSTAFQYDSLSERNTIRSFFLVAYLLIIDICFDVTGLSINLPGKKSHSTALRVFSRIIWSFIFSGIILFFYALIINFFWE